MADDAARIEKLEAELRQLREEKAALADDVERYKGVLSEALEQQTVTADVLRVIATAPTDLQAVLQAIVDAASRLCGAERAALNRLVDQALVMQAVTGFPMNRGHRDELERTRRGRPVIRSSIAGRAVLERRTVYVPDILAAGAEYAESLRGTPRTGNRSQVSVPLLSGGEVLGTLSLHDVKSNAFDASQIALL